MPAAGDTIEVIRTARPTDSVRTEKDRMLGERRDAETRWTAMREQGARLRASVKELRTAVDAASAREKQAKKAKRDADRSVATAEKRDLDASIRSADAELAIAERRDQVLPNDPSQRSAFEELTSRWLQALRTRAARGYDLEDRRFKVIEAQIELLKRQRA